MSTEEKKKISKHLTDIDPRLARVFASWMLKHPRYLRSSVRLFGAIKKAKKRRVALMAEGVMIPPALILSITSRCNLACPGCYASAAGNLDDTSCQQGPKPDERKTLALEKWKDMIQEASGLGVFFFVLAGGEPFLYPGLLEICKDFPDRFFLILTNGTAISEKHYRALKGVSNTAIIVSLEGNCEMTDSRRGKGVHEKALETLKRLEKLGVPNGISATITRNNYEYWMEAENLDTLIEQGLRIGVFLEYIPTSFGSPGTCFHPEEAENDTAGENSLEEKTEDGEGGKSPAGASPKGDSTDASANPWPDSGDFGLILTPEERQVFRERIVHFRNSRSIYIVHSPGDEEFFGGCVSAGRGFAHVTPGGDLTPCPVSDIATHNLVKSTLREALTSPLFEKIRENEHLLETEGMPCALFAHPKEMDELAREVGAYRTSQAGRKKN